jgi:hypothetical protein
VTGQSQDQGQHVNCEASASGREPICIAAAEESMDTTVDSLAGSWIDKLTGQEMRLKREDMRVQVSPLNLDRSTSVTPRMATVEIATSPFAETDPKARANVDRSAQVSPHGRLTTLTTLTDELTGQHVGQPLDFDRRPPAVTMVTREVMTSAMTEDRGTSPALDDSAVQSEAQSATQSAVQSALPVEEAVRTEDIGCSPLTFMESKGTFTDASYLSPPKPHPRPPLPVPQADPPSPPRPPTPPTPKAHIETQTDPLQTPIRTPPFPPSEGYGGGELTPGELTPSSVSSSDDFPSMTALLARVRIVP